MVEQEKVYLLDYASRIKRNLQRIKNLDVEPELKLAAEKFVNYLYAQNYSWARISYYTDKFVVLLPKAKKLSLDEGHLIDFLTKLREDTKLNDTSKKEYAMVYRILLQHNYSLDHDDKQLKILRTKNRKDYVKIPEKMITTEEIKTLVREAHTYKSKAYIMGLYETGARIGEYHTLLYKDVVFDEYGALVHINNSKTMRRKLRVVFSVPYLRQWYELHPTKNPTDPLWITYKPIYTGNYGKKVKSVSYQRVSYQFISNMLRKLGKKCQINKPLNPHNFRKSRATELAKSLSDQQLKQYMGWTRDSRMASIYIHLNEDALEESILALNNINIPKKIRENGKITTTMCSRCNSINTENARFCSNCGLAIETETVKEVEQLQNDILNSGLSIEQFAARNFDKPLPNIIEELVKLNKEVLNKLEESAKK